MLTSFQIHQYQRGVLLGKGELTIENLRINSKCDTRLTEKNILNVISGYNDNINMAINMINDILYRSNHRLLTINRVAIDKYNIK